MKPKENISEGTLHHNLPDMVFPSRQMTIPVSRFPESKTNTQYYHEENNNIIQTFKSYLIMSNAHYKNNSMLLQYMQPIMQS